MSTLHLDAHTPPPDSHDIEDLIPSVLKQAEQWLDVTKDHANKKEAKSAEQLAAVVHDPVGLDFTMAFVDRVARPEDNRVAAREFSELANPFKESSEVPDFLSLWEKLLVWMGSIAAPILPSVVMPLARNYLKKTVGHLVLSSEGKQLNKLLDDFAEQGIQLNLNLLGEAVLGDGEANNRLDSTLKLLQNPKVDYVSIKASSVVSQLNPWDIQGSLARLKKRLRPLYREALSRNPHPFINLDMEEYKDLYLTISLFTELMMEDEFLELEAGIVLQAYLPDTFEALKLLTKFAHERVARGGANIKVRLVKGANLSMEKVDGEIHDWPQAPYHTKAEVDANYLRLVDWALRPEHADAIRIGVASHNMFDVALAHELSVKRGVQNQLDIEMLQGMSPSQARAVRETTGSLILYTPVVSDDDFDVAVSYLVRRLEENSAKENFLYSLFAPDQPDNNGKTPMQDQQDRFLASVRDRWSTFAGPNRTQNRAAEAKDHHGIDGGATAEAFHNEPDTDPSLPQNREWALQWIGQDPGQARTPQISDPTLIDAVVARAKAHAEKFNKTSARERADLLLKAANALADNRGRLIQAAVWDCGKTVGETDPEISEAIDFATYYAHSAVALDELSSTFTPHDVTVVTPPWNFPIAIPLGGIFAALASGSTVILKPAPQALRCAEVYVDILRSAGITDDMLQLVNADEGEGGKRLMSHPDVDAIILTGASETARLFRSWKPEMVINAETSGKNAIIVTPAADPDLAAADILKSAYGHAGQKCSADSLIILVGSVGKSDRFRHQLVDAIKTLRVGPGYDISTTMNGIIEPPSEKLWHGLTRLDDDESWLVQPEQLNDEGTLWSPGLRDNVKEGSWFHTHECFGPVAGIMYAKNLEEAIRFQNTTGFGLTGGIHSLDEDEIDTWKRTVEVGNAYVNRGITGAIVRRQSFGGWKNSSIGTGAKAGGPNYVAQLGHWAEGDLAALPTAEPRDIEKNFVTTATKYLPESVYSWISTAAQSDAYWWAKEFSVTRDETGLRAESNVFRYRPVLQAVQVRILPGAKFQDILRIQLASMITGAPVAFSGSEQAQADLAKRTGAEAFAKSQDWTPYELRAALEELSISMDVHTDEVFAQRLAGSPGTRVRALGEVSEDLYRAAAESGSVIITAPVLADGRRELLPLLLEQAVSTTEHRFGYIADKSA